jgi:glyoxylase-like metal-dependent hydrolase (beta-lactamase superfamily II)
MADSLDFDREPPGLAGEAKALSPLVTRVMAGNAGPFTFTGTCTYIVGREQVAVIDPGPDDPAHRQALLAALAGRSVSHILVTHTHRDHSPGVAALKAITGASVVGCGPHQPFREVAVSEAARLDASADLAFAPDHIMADGDVVTGDGFTLEAVATPGHTANHLAFALREEAALFSGDHVMAWSTTIVAPPDGAMAPFMASLEKLRARDERIFWPGHGGPVTDPARFLRALVGHRRMREAAILARLAAGDRSISEIVLANYEGLAPGLRGAAALSTLAHLEDLVGRGLARVVEGEPALDALFSLA